PFYTRSVGNRSELLVGIFGGDVGLSFIRLGDKFPERFVRRSAHAVRISSALRRPVMHLQREILKHQAHVRLRGHQGFDCGLRRFAGGALQVAEFHDNCGRILGTAIRPGDPLFQRLARGRERLRPRRAPEPERARWRKSSMSVAGHSRKWRAKKNQPWLPTEARSPNRWPLISPR